MRKTLVVVSTALAVGTFAGLATPASAGDTTTTFTVSAGALNVSAPVSSALGTAAAGTSASAQLGATTVTDARAALLGAWTATVVSSAFTGTVNAQVIPATAVTYWSGAATATTGLGVPVPGQLLAANAVAIDTAKTAFSKAAGIGSNSTTWNPTVSVAVPSAAVADDYSGTITHSVA